MIKLVGLGHLSDKEIYLLLLVAVCASFLVGWVMEMIMGRIGFGIFGNAIVTFLGICVGLFVYNRYYGRLTSPDVMMVMGFVIVSVMLHLVVISILRRMLRM